MSAAISAAQNGARVLVVEAANKFYRGGNTRHTRNFRFMHEDGEGPVTGAYDHEEFWNDLLRVTDGNTEAELAHLTIDKSRELRSFFMSNGVHFQPALGGTLGLARTNGFFLGGGRALLNALYLKAESIGIDIWYEAEAISVDIVDGFFTSSTIRNGKKIHHVRATTLVAASGGFESNIEWLSEYWGPRADNFLIRGTRFNTGTLLRLLLDHNVMPVGDPMQCHAVAIDARAPKFDSGIVTRHDCIVFSVVVNRDARRFYDEGEDFWPKRYAIWGRLLAEQPGQIGYAIFDSKAEGLFMPSVYPPIQADTIEALANKLDLNSQALAHTIAEFNSAATAVSFTPDKLDGHGTHGLTPPKSNWAVPIDAPPFYAYPLRPGITFTYLGTKVNRDARMVMRDGRPAANMFAAGEIMAGNILGKGYLAGLGMTIGGVFGRIAGEEAAAYARN